MRPFIRTSWGLLLLLAGIVAACKKNDDGAAPGPTPVQFQVPAGWPAIRYNFAANPLTEEGIALGRKLFYDGILSQDGNFPCASCHQQVGAFGTFDHNLSHGFNNSHTLRNAPPLQNLAWHTAFHADAGIINLDDQPISPLTSPIEMAETMDHVLSKLRATTTYPALFKAAFGDATITSQRMTKALSQFMLTMVSASSKYDQVKQGKASFNLPEGLGYDIFKQKCAACHQEPLFTDFSLRNNGLPVDPVLLDFGRMRITKLSSDSLKFKVPSLRNVMVTYPYGHDGSVYDIYTMLEHYNTGIQAGPTLDPLLKNKIPLSNFEKGQLVAFLATLTDSSFLKNEALAAPK